MLNLGQLGVQATIEADIYSYKFPNLSPGVFAFDNLKVKIEFAMEANALVIYFENKKYTCHSFFEMLASKNGVKSIIDEPVSPFFKKPGT